MNDSILNSLKNFIEPERVLLQEPMKNHTTFRVGGAAAALVSVNHTDELKSLLTYLAKENVPYMILGNGSNLLVSDGGYDGVMVKLSGDFLKLEATGTKITAGSGVLLTKVCKLAEEKSLSGLEFAYGIPGTVGGAMVMNAGAYGGEMKDVVSRVTVLTKDGDIVDLEPSELAFSYRSSVIRKESMCVLFAEFTLADKDAQEITAKMNELLGRRKEKQPLEYPSAGSTFKRPEGHFAGALIEEAGMKGNGVGGAEVSKKHAGFVINKGNASAKDVYDTISLVKQKVLENSGISLEEEVILVGKFE